LRFFAPHGRHVAPTGVKFGRGGGDRSAKFHPHRCNDKGVGLPKLKFLLRFDQNVEYKRHAGAYPFRDFHKICKVYTSFQDALGIKILLDLLKGLWSYGGLPPNFQRPLAAKRFRGARTCSRSSVTIPSLVGLGFHPPPGWPKTLSFLSVCLFVRHAFERQRLCA